MAKYILLVNWTDQGIRNIKDSAKRLDAGRALAKERGCVLESFFMTMGSFDNVAVIEAPDDETIAKYVLTLGSEGNLRTVTLKAFPEEAYKKIIPFMKQKSRMANAQLTEEEQAAKPQNKRH